ncbi:unnamed protein product [Caenorhabditis sp. 36 PRJEB53466]|nr:unnamed protein product [Caenorhabditis sp. 36 PRJEB53466]
MADMISYITRFKVRFETEISKLETHPLPQAALHNLQITRARRVVDAVNVILKMGPRAIAIDHRKFEDTRAIIFNNTAAFSCTQRLIRDGAINPPRMVPQHLLPPMRRR